MYCLYWICSCYFTSGALCSVWLENAYTGSDLVSLQALYALYDMRRNCDHRHHHPQSPLKTWVALNGRRSANRFSELFPDEVKRNNFIDPVIFEVNLGQGLVKAFIDPENEFCIQDKLSQVTIYNFCWSNKNQEIHICSVLFCLCLMSCCFA